jgi:hypothetical protein
MKKLLPMNIFFSVISSYLIERDEIILLTNADNPLYQFAKLSEIVDFDIDSAKSITAKLGEIFRIKIISFLSLIHALMAKPGYFAIPVVTSTNVKRKNVDFSIPDQNNIRPAVLIDREQFSDMKNLIALLEGKVIGI